MMSTRIIRMSELATTPATPSKPVKTGLLPVSPATVWRWVREGKFPKPYKLGACVTVWDVEQVNAFIKQRAGEAS